MKNTSTVHGLPQEYLDDLATGEDIISLEEATQGRIEAEEELEELKSMVGA